MRRYCPWAGNEKGTPENKTKCIADVQDGGRSVMSHQCRRRRGFGPDGLYCRFHAARLSKGRYVDVPPDAPA